MDTTTGQDIPTVPVESYSYDESSGIIIAKVELPHLIQAFGLGTDVDPTASLLLGAVLGFVGKETPEPFYEIMEIHTRAGDSFFSKGQGVVLLTCKPALVLEEEEVEYETVEDLLEVVKEIRDLMVQYMGGR